MAYFDMSVPDFDTKKIDAAVVSDRNADLIDYLMENYHQAYYGQQIVKVLREQDEEVGMGYIEIKKIKFLHASKTGSAMEFEFKVWIKGSSLDVKHTGLKFHFRDGISDSKTVNDLFSYMNRYIKARKEFEEMNMNSN